METKSIKRREMAKNLAIVLLTVTALLLAARLQGHVLSHGEGGWMDWLSALIGGEKEINSGGSWEGMPGRVRPQRMAVRNQNGCYGVQYDDGGVEALFGELGTLVGEALGSAGTPVQVSEETWRQALGRSGAAIYCDFLSSLPLELLSAWLGDGTVNEALSGSTRRLLLADQGGHQAVLYYSNESEGLYYACSTAVAVEGRLDAAVEPYPPNNTSFAFQQEELYGALAPYVMLQPDAPRPPVYAAAPPGWLQEDGGMEQLLRALSFQPQTSSVYTSSEGRVVREGTDTLRVGKTGIVIFSADGEEEPRYPVSGSGMLDRIEAASALVEGSLGLWCGEGDIYLSALKEGKEGAVELYFSYSLNGAFVQVGELGYCAQVTVGENAITGVILQFRTYTSTDTRSVVLPERQAAASLGPLDRTGGELLLAYSDGGGEEVRAGWVVGPVS